MSSSSPVVSSSLSVSPDYSGPTESRWYNRYYHFSQRDPHRAAFLLGAGTFGFLGCCVGAGQFVLSGLPLGPAAVRTGLAGSIAGAFYGSASHFLDRHITSSSPVITHSISGCLTFSLLSGAVGGGRSALIGAIAGATVCPAGNALWRYITRPKPAQIIYTEAPKSSKPFSVPSWFPVHPTTEEEIEKLKESRQEYQKHMEAAQAARQHRINTGAANFNSEQ